MKDYSKYFQKPSFKEAKSRINKKINIVKEGLEEFPLMEAMGKGKKFLIKTYGCQGNEADSEVISGIMLKLGFEKVMDEKESDIIILNTCAIRDNAEMKVFGEIGRLKSFKSEKPDLLLAICGCMPQEEGVVDKILKKHPQVDLVFGTHNINRLPLLIKEALFSKEKVVEVFSNDNNIYENLPVSRKSSLKAWVTIMYGCDKFCTYCIVPYTRGKERSRKIEDIVDEVIKLKKQGYKEVTLLGQNVNAFGIDGGETFGELLSQVANTKIDRVRFVTSHPWNFSDHMIDVISSNQNIMPHIHLPVQSGSNEILKKMARRYSVEEYINLYKKLKDNKKGISITTDIIVGFPNETKEDFQKTLNLVDLLEFDNAFTFIYSPRENTPASKMEDNIKSEEKEERLKTLIEKVSFHALKNNKKLEGKILKVLVEGKSRKNKEILSGYSEENKLVNFKGKVECVGKIVKVKITKAKTWTLDGEIVNEQSN